MAIPIWNRIELHNSFILRLHTGPEIKEFKEIEVSMNNLSNDNAVNSRVFADQLRQLRDAGDSSEICIPDLQQWMHYWNDEESDAVNLRNIRHWMTCIHPRN